MTPPRRVVITGIGAITPLGHTLGDTAAALAAGRTAIGPATVFDASGFACADAGEVREWDPRPSFRAPKALKLADRPARFAVAAAGMALADAGWPRESCAFEDLGIAIGSSGSDLQAADIGRALARDPGGEPGTDIACFADRVLRGLNPLWLLVSLPNMTSAHVAIQLQARGPNTTIMSDWAAGHQAIGEAAGWIEAGEADAVLAGGADSALHPFAFAAYEQAGFLRADQHARRFVPGEGAALFLLEERDAAIARGAPIRGELRAYASRAGCPDSFHGLARTLNDAMAAAGWTADLVARCAVSAPPAAGDASTLESAVRSVLGLERTPIAFHPQLGNALAAAAPIDAAVLCASARGRERVLTSAVGCSGEAVTLAIDVATR